MPKGTTIKALGGLERGKAAQGRKRKGGSQCKLGRVGVSQSEWGLGGGQAG